MHTEAQKTSASRAWSRWYRVEVAAQDQLFEPGAFRLATGYLTLYFTIKKHQYKRTKQNAYHRHNGYSDVLQPLYIIISSIHIVRISNINRNRFYPRE